MAISCLFPYFATFIIKILDLIFDMVCPIAGFLGNSAGKESACNAGDPGLNPGTGRSAGEGIGYPFQHCWASLVVQVVKNPPAMQKTWLPSPGWEDPLEKGKATHSSILGLPC